MKLEKQKYLTYTLISLYLILVMGVLPALQIISYDTAAPLFFLGIIGSAIFLSVKESYGKGNIKEHDMSSKKELWKDSTPQVKLKKSLLAWSGILILSILLAIGIATQGKHLDIGIEMQFFLITTTLIGFIISFINVLILGIRLILQKKAAPRNCVIYEDGIQVRNTFVPKEQIKSVKVSGAMSRGKPVLRIQIKDEEIKFVEVNDNKGCAQALVEAGIIAKQHHKTKALQPR